MTDIASAANVTCVTDTASVAVLTDLTDVAGAWRPAVSGQALS